MANFFILKESLDHSIIGSNYPQCVGVLEEYVNEYSNKKSLFYFAHKKGIKVNYVPDLTAIKIGEKTKVTDLISCALGPGNDLIVSNNFKELLSRYKTSDVQIFKCVLNKKKSNYDYCWIHFVYNLEKNVDYTKSKFSHPDSKLRSKLDQIVDYETFLDFYEHQDAFGLVRSSKVVIQHQTLDFFVIGRYNQKKYVSEKLKNEIEALGLTGITFEPASDIRFVQS